MKEPAMDLKTVEALAERLHRARKEGREIPPLGREHPALTVADAYRIQAAGIARRIADGERVVGMKMGLTSEAKRRQMNLHAPVYGVLTAQMEVQGGVFRIAGSLHPKIEPELAFRTRVDLHRPLSREEALDACEVALPALELLDSRYTDFKYFSLPDVVADNSSSFMFALGRTERPPRSLDLSRVTLRMEVDGRTVQSATGDAISGDPILSVVQLSQLLAEHGGRLAAGSIVLAGAATAAHMLRAGERVRLIADELGEVVVDVQ